MNHAQPLLLASLCLFATACSTPTLQQRQDNWRKVRDVTRAQCLVGQADPAMPPEVRIWCESVLGP